MNTPKTHQALKLLASLAAPLAVAAIGAVASVSARSFYADLRQPPWAPPGWLFGPVWTALYTLMGIATWLVWRQTTTGAVRKELAVFGVQLLFNGLWSWLFFKWQLGAAAFVDILILLALIVLNVAIYWRRSPWAGILLLPYLAWVGFAAALCYAVWQLNPQTLG